LFLDMVCILAGLVPLLGLMLSYAVHVLICLAYICQQKCCAA